MQLIDSSRTLLPTTVTNGMTPHLPDSVFMIQLRRMNGPPLGRLARAALVAWAVFLLSGFGVARLLKPDPRGFGTHQQIGLPECSMRRLFSRPCPGCGMTTCFSHFVRGEFVEATRANPAGILLATLCAVMIPWSLLSAFRGVLWLVHEPMHLFIALVAAIGAVALLSWLLIVTRSG